MPFSGPQGARLIVVGEAPGEKEVETGRPFSGRAGRLLMEGLEGIGLTRGECFFVNSVSHRPIGNATPTPAQIQSCRPIFDRQLALCGATWILAAGSIALGQFAPGAKITAWATYPFAWEDRLVYPVLHPAAALRSGATRAWRDSLGELGVLLDVPELMGLFPPRCVSHLERQPCGRCLKRLDRGRLGIGWAKQKMKVVRGQESLL